MTQSSGVLPDGQRKISSPERSRMRGLPVGSLKTSERPAAAMRRALDRVVLGYVLQTSGLTSRDR
ncbi:hypothetical protein ABTM33_18785, partial [Acinetobacter baumannii]